MALPDQLVLQVGTQFSFADHATDFVGGDAKTSLVQGSPTNVQLDLTSVADTAGRESAKLDLGVSRAPAYSVMASLEFAATPVTGSIVELYWAPSPDSSAGNGNPMNIDGADAVSPSGIGTLAELVKSCVYIGNFICTNDPTPAVQTAFIGILVPPERFGILLVKNESGAAFHSDAVELHVVFNPILEMVID